MKKNIGFISLDSALIQWLQEKLPISAPDTAGTKELIEGLETLINGRSDLLMVELADTENVMPVTPTIRCGTLSIDPKSRKVLRDGA